MTTTTAPAGDTLRVVTDDEAVGTRIEREPIWPDYFARLGQPDAANWQYKGYWKDTARVWRAYYSLAFGHPVVTYQGTRHMLQSAIYRISNEETGKHLEPLCTLITPFVIPIVPPLSIAMVSTIPFYLENIRHIDRAPLFRPFNKMGWANYVVMFATMFAMHSYKQYRMGWSPDHALKHSSKVFWHDFFEQNLPEGQSPTKQYAVIKDHVLKGVFPDGESFVVKPTSAGAGQYLRTWKWDAGAEVFRCDDIERTEGEPEVMGREDPKDYILRQYRNAVVERLELMRDPFPIGSFRIMTLNVDTDAELIAAVFLPADEGSNSTAYFDLDTHLINYETSSIGMPIRPQSEGKWTGIHVPELNDVIEACIHLHNQLPAHVEVSWDVLLTDHGPVFLEGNIFPPGCDYKLTIFKKWENFRYLKNRLLHLAP